MIRTLFAFVCLLMAGASLSAQSVDVKICDILAHPQSFDGKMVRVTGTVIAGFDEFVVKDTSCKQSVNAIWLAYPEGTKAKSGPAAVVYLQLAKNSPGQVVQASRTPVTLDMSKDFKQFDSLLSAPAKTSGHCLGCVRSTVTATLTGRLDGVDNPSLEKTGNMFTSVRGFGNLNRYPARLVLQSISNVTANEIDYSKPAPAGSADVALGLGPDQAKRAADAYGAQGEQNGVDLSFGGAGILRKDDGGKGSADSPDGLLFNVIFGSDQLKGPGMSEAIAHTGTHIADLRENPAARNLFQLEAHGWAITVLSAVNQNEKTLTAPGGYQMWNSAWSEADREKLLPGTISGYLTDWAALSR